MGAHRRHYESWLCPFCGTIASGEIKERVLCDGRECSCGAVALAAPAVDMDEIIDDALGIFRIQIRAESRGFDALMLDDILGAGVEVREGQRARVGAGIWADHTSMWFRRSGGPARS